MSAQHYRNDAVAHYNKRGKACIQSQFIRISCDCTYSSPFCPTAQDRRVARFGQLLPRDTAALCGTMVRLCGCISGTFDILLHIVLLESDLLAC
jgi:hypothetical protein